MNSLELRTNKATPSKVCLTILISLYLEGSVHRSRVLLSFIANQAETTYSENELLFRESSSFETFCASINEYFSLHGKSRSGLNEATEITLLLRKCTLSIRGPDDLYHWSKEVSASIALRLSTASGPSCYSLSSRSVIGLFMQNMCVSLQLLSYTEYDWLYSSIQIFVNNSTAFKSDLPPNSHCSSLKNCSDDNVLTRTEILELTASQVSMIEMTGVCLSDECKQSFERYASYATLIKGISHCGMKDPASLASYHYLRYLRCLNEGDYHASYDALHQYFDYMVSKGSKMFYHFALIAKAALHIVFGEKQNALDTIEEAGNVARDQKDEIALTYVLTWLFKVMTNHQDENFSGRVHKVRNMRLLEFLSQKDYQRNSLFSAAVLQAEYDYIVSAGASPRRCFLSMSKTLFSSMCGTMKTTRNVAHIASSHWLTAGYPYLAEAYVDLSLIFTLKYVLTREDQDYARAQCDILYWKGEGEILAQKLRSLSEPPCCLVVPIDPLQTWYVIFMVKISLKRGHFQYANELLSLIRYLPSVDSTTQGEILRLQASLMSHTDNCRDALAILNAQVGVHDRLTKAKSPREVVSCLLIKSDILVQADRLGCSFILLLQQITLASSFGLFDLVAEAAVRLVSLLVKSNDIEMVSELSMVLAPILHRCDNTDLCSDIYIQLAKPLIISLRRLGATSLSENQAKPQIIRYITLSLSGFAKSFNMTKLSECISLKEDIQRLDLCFKESKLGNICDLLPQLELGVKLLEGRQNGNPQAGLVTSLAST